MSRNMSPYEIAWRKGAGHAVPSDGVLHDDDDLEQLTAPPAKADPPAPPVTPPVQPLAPAADPAAAATPAAAPQAKPGKK